MHSRPTVAIRTKSDSTFTKTPLRRYPLSKTHRNSFTRSFIISQYSGACRYRPHATSTSAWTDNSHSFRLPPAFSCAMHNNKPTSAGIASGETVVICLLAQSSGKSGDSSANWSQTLRANRMIPEPPVSASLSSRTHRKEYLSCQKISLTIMNPFKSLDAVAGLGSAARRSERNLG